MPYTITLADGRQLTGLGMNGDNFVSAKKVDETIFKNNLSIMTVSDGETEIIYRNVELIQQQEWSDGSWYLAFREQTKRELEMSALQAEITRKDAQIVALSDRGEFLEDCIAEMATLLYGGAEETE